MKVSRNLFVPASLAAALFFPTASIAQNAPPPVSTGQQMQQPPGAAEHRGGFMRAMRNLNLSDAQKQRIQALATQFHQAHAKGTPPDPQAMKAFHDQIMAVLTPAQQTQFESNLQSMRQQPENGAPGEGMMQRFAALNLSAQQKTQIQTLLSQFRQAHPPGSQRDPQAMQTLRGQIDAILTPQQRAQLQAERQQRDGNESGQPEQPPHR